MTHRTLPTAWFVVFASLTAQSYAAEPELKAGLVTESRTYCREELNRQGRPGGSTQADAMAQPVEVQIQRVTVALEGERVTAEWSPSMNRWPGMLAKDFPLDADVQAAIKGNELRLIHGRPQRDAEHPDEWLCPVSLEPLYSKLHAQRSNSPVHSLCLALSLALDLLHGVVEKGGSVSFAAGQPFPFEAYAFGVAASERGARKK